jgi:hypothetical protein
VTASRHRNQLARVIENALMLRATDGTFAERVYVTLITPQVFRDRSAPSRLYRYKWDEYTQDHSGLLGNLRDCGLASSHDLPSPQDRLGALILNWRSYEELAFAAPSTSLREALMTFYRSHAGKELSQWNI